MRNLLCILTLLIYGQLCFGQTKNKLIPVNKTGDTTLWYKLQQEKFEKAGLRDLTKTKDTLHFRFSSEIQAVDIWTTDYITFRGMLTNFTTGYEENKNGYGNQKFYSKKIQIETNKAKQISDLFKSKSILNMPPQDSIDGWGSGLDGVTYFIEYSTPTYYSFKSYWTPYAYKDEVDEANRFYELTELLEKRLDLRNSFNQFIHTLPKGNYRAGGLLLISTSKKKNKRK